MADFLDDLGIDGYVIPGLTSGPGSVLNLLGHGFRVCQLDELATESLNAAEGGGGSPKNKAGGQQSTTLGAASLNRKVGINETISNRYFVSNSHDFYLDRTKWKVKEVDILLKEQRIDVLVRLNGRTYVHPYGLELKAVATSASVTLKDDAWNRSEVLKATSGNSIRSSHNPYFSIMDHTDVATWNRNHNDPRTALEVCKPISAPTKAELLGIKSFYGMETGSILGMEDRVGSKEGDLLNNSTGYGSGGFGAGMSPIIDPRTRGSPSPPPIGAARGSPSPPNAATRGSPSGSGSPTSPPKGREQKSSQRISCAAGDSSNSNAKVNAHLKSRYSHACTAVPEKPKGSTIAENPHAEQQLCTYTTPRDIKSDKNVQNNDISYGNFAKSKYNLLKRANIADAKQDINKIRDRDIISKKSEIGPIESMIDSIGELEENIHVPLPLSIGRYTRHDIENFTAKPVSGAMHLARKTLFKKKMSKMKETMKETKLVYYEEPNAFDPSSKLNSSTCNPTCNANSNTRKGSNDIAIENDVFWELKMAVAQFLDEGELYGMNAHSGRCIEATIFVPVLRCTWDPELEDLENFNIPTLQKVPYYCDGVILGATRSIKIRHLSSHPRSPTGRDLSDTFANLRDRAVEQQRDRSVLEVLRDQNSIPKKKKPAFPKVKRERSSSLSASLSLSPENVWTKKSSATTVGLVASRDNKKTQNLNFGSPRGDPTKDLGKSFTLGQSQMMMGKRKSEVPSSANDNSWEDDVVKNENSSKLWFLSKKGQMVSDPQTAVNKVRPRVVEIDFFFEDENLHISMEVFLDEVGNNTKIARTIGKTYATEDEEAFAAGCRLPSNFETSAELLNWLETWTTAGVYRQHSIWRPVMVNVLHTDSVIQQLLSKYHLNRSPFMIPQFCLDCRQGRRLIHWNLDLYRDSKVLPEQYKHCIRKQFCDHEPKTIIYYCPSFCCFYNCCIVCHQKRQGTLAPYLERFAKAGLVLGTGGGGKIGSDLGRSTATMMDGDEKARQFGRRIPIMAGGFIKITPKEEAERDDKQETLRKVSSLLVRQSLQMVIPPNLFGEGGNNGGGVPSAQSKTSLLDKLNNPNKHSLPPMLQMMETANGNQINQSRSNKQKNQEKWKEENKQIESDDEEENKTYQPDLTTILLRLVKDLPVDGRFIRIATKRGLDRPDMQFFVLSPIAHHAVFGDDDEDVTSRNYYFHELLSAIKKVHGKEIKGEGKYITSRVHILETKLEYGENPLNSLESMLRAWIPCPNDCGVWIDRHRSQTKHLRQYCRVQVERNMRDAMTTMNDVLEAQKAASKEAPQKTNSCSLPSSSSLSSSSMGGSSSSMGQLSDQEEDSSAS